MRAFVTGGSGFVGKTLITALRARGDEVRALARSDAAAKAVEAAGATAVRGDLSQVDVLREGMRGCDVVFHAAAKVETFGPRREFRRDTVDGTRHVCEAARAAGVKRLVHVSTEAVLVGGPPIVDADESWPLPRKPIGMYPWSKGRAEEVVRAANAPGVLETVIVRPRMIWGAGDTVLLPTLIETVKASKFAWIGGGTHRTSTVHVKNVAHGLVLAAERGRAGETYFVTDGEPVEMKAFLTAYLGAAGVTIDARSVPRGVARVAAALAEWAWRLSPMPGAPPLDRTTVRLVGEEVTVSDTKARRELGYAPVVTREQGLAELRARA